MTDDEFVAAFESCRLSRQEWTHTAHIRMAWIYLHRGCLAAATEQARTGIQRLNTSRDNLEGYHETMTTAYMHVIHDRIRGRSRIEPFDAFRAANPDLFDWQNCVLLRYYTRETLFSQRARTQFVPPDLLPLPHE